MVIPSIPARGLEVVYDTSRIGHSYSVSTGRSSYVLSTGYVVYVHTHSQAVVIVVSERLFVPCAPGVQPSTRGTAQRTPHWHLFSL